MAKTKISWTEETWNPVTGCTKVSAGCKNCYAERMAKRLKGMGQPRYQNGKHGFALTLHRDKVHEPLRWKTPRMVFVNSMSDLFHPKVPIDFIMTAFHVMRDCPQHTFQVLTKRAERLAELGGAINWPDNVWMGVSVENADYVSRIELLRKTPAAIRFLSLEPLLGPIPRLPLREIDWVIVGGESGPGARPMDLEWAREIRGQCREANIPFFYKQRGARVGKGSNELDGQVIQEYPTVRN